MIVLVIDVEVAVFASVSIVVSADLWAMGNKIG